MSMPVREEIHDEIQQAYTLGLIEGARQARMEIMQEMREWWGQYAADYLRVQLAS